MVIRLNITQNAGLGSMILKVLSQLAVIPADEEVHVFATSPVYAKHDSENVWDWYFVNPPLTMDTVDWPDATYNEEAMPFNTRLGENRSLLESHRRLISRRVSIRFSIYGQARRIIRPEMKTLGIHYRGTDKSREVPRVPYETVLAQINELLPGHEAVFLATDEAAAAEWFAVRIPGLIVNPHKRTDDPNGLHITQGDRQQADETMRDIYCLSLCDTLLVGRGNVSDLALMFGGTENVHYLREPAP